MKTSLFITLLSFGLSFQDFYKHEQFQEFFDSFLVELPDGFFDNIGCVEGDCDNGEGTFVLFPCIDKGEFKDNILHGEGIRTFSNGDVMSGTWVDNEMVYGMYLYGRGKWFGDIYVGDFKNGNKSGVGVYKRKSDGEIYVGEWLRGLPNGKGKKIDIEGHILEGLFYEGEIIEGY